jgi:hypothetical protein
MKHFFRYAVNYNTAPLMVAVMQKQDVLESIAEGVSGVRLPHVELPRLKAPILEAMMVNDAMAVAAAVLVRLSPKITYPIGNAERDGWSFSIILQAKDDVMLLAGDEAVALKTGEAWWVDARKDGHIINKSDDDVFLLFLDMRSE